MTVKIIIDLDLCEANARCEDEAPAVFRVEEDDTLTVLLPEVGPEHYAVVERAERLCPRGAIRLEDI